MGFFRHINSLLIEELLKVSSQYIRGEEGDLWGLLRDPEPCLGRWARFFSTLQNTRSDKLDPDIGTEIPQQPTAHALGIEPTVEGVAAALRSIANAKQ